VAGRPVAAADQFAHVAEGVGLGSAHGSLVENLKMAGIVPERRQIGQEPATAGLW
jgi:hypothetical protein